MSKDFEDNGPFDRPVDIPYLPVKLTNPKFTIRKLIKLSIGMCAVSFWLYHFMTNSESQISRYPYSLDQKPEIENDREDVIVLPG